jgi:hypothetical protein
MLFRVGSAFGDIGDRVTGRFSVCRIVSSSSGDPAAPKAPAHFLLRLPNYIKGLS